MHKTLHNLLKKIFWGGQSGGGGNVFLACEVYGWRFSKVSNIPLFSPKDQSTVAQGFVQSTRHWTHQPKTQERLGGGGRGQNTDLSPQPLDPESSALTTQPSNLSFHNHITIIIKSDQMQPRYIHTPAIISAHLPRHLSTWVQPERAQRAPFPAPAVHGRCGHVQTLCPPPSGTGHAPHQGQCWRSCRGPVMGMTGETGHQWSPSSHTL